MYNLKKTDFLLLSFIVVFSILLLLILGRSSISVNEKLEIYVGNELYGVYSLDEDQTIDIGGTNTCEIKDGKVSMIYADCPDKICTASSAISSSGKSIICIPNRVTLIISGDEGESENDSANEFDAVVK